MAIGSTSAQRRTALAAVAILVGSTLAVALAAPAGADLSTGGLWIFPHERQEKVLAGTLGEHYYNTTSGDDWIADAFFADSDADGATVQVDFYNPTGGDFGNVILWVAVSDDDLFTSIDFSGGSSGDMSVGVDDLGGGTPTTGASLPDFVYPAFYTSYGVGDVDAGSSDIVTVTLDITGDFDGGLVLRLDYTATDDNGDDVSGPFEAGMSVYEWGDLPDDEEGDCPDEAEVDVGLTLTPDYETGKEFDVGMTITLSPSLGYEATDVTLDLKEILGGFSLTDLGLGDLEEYGTAPKFDIGGLDQELVLEATLTGSPLLLPGDESGLTLEVSWDGCDGGGSTTKTLSVQIEKDPTGAVKSASWWANDLKDAIRDQSRDRQRADYDVDQYDTFLQAIALHSEVFTYGPWDGTDPMGGDDAGWIDGSNLSGALSVLRKDGRGNGNMKELQQELLALWLNVASGRVNLDSGLTTPARGHQGSDDDGSHGHSRSHLPGVPADVQGVISGAETNLTDYVDSLSSSTSSSHGNGHGDDDDDDEDDHGSQRSARSLWGSSVLCWLVNSGWLRVAS